MKELTKEEIKEIVDFIDDYSFVLTNGGMYKSLDKWNRNIMMRRKKLLVNAKKKLQKVL